MSFAPIPSSPFSLTSFLFGPSKEEKEKAINEFPSFDRYWNNVQSVILRAREYESRGLLNTAQKQALQSLSIAWGEWTIRRTPWINEIRLAADKAIRAGKVERSQIPDWIFGQAGNAPAGLAAVPLIIAGGVLVIAAIAAYLGGPAVDAWKLEKQNQLEQAQTLRELMNRVIVQPGATPTLLPPLPPAPPPPTAAAAIASTASSAFGIVAIGALALFFLLRSRR